ncbi:hypothetical protein BCR39DRAFT_590016 [Naematelia encephala]|uniref:UV radiation resistance protein and autophagy-related subunit 14-domain-containing protein n=1 Tax=Naematelia encephala TaxID=71784 RepID=A0A1Y2AT26_9TREE|nr:hypothetical protein BCR39DRAFT_590016 [Naematelia encephala]
MSSTNPVAKSGEDGPGATLQPRIRHITGIRIRQLTLPESLPLASKLVTSDNLYSEPEVFTLGESSNLTASPDLNGSFHFSHERRNSSSSHKTLTSRSARHERRPSTATLSTENLVRKRSTSSSRFSQLNSPVATSSIRPRTARPRAPTLAGEALEYGHSSAGGHAQASIDDYERRLESADVGRRKLARSFVVLKLPQRSLETPGTNGVVPGPKRANSDDKLKSRPNTETRRTPPRTPSSTSLSPPSTPSHQSRPSMSSSLSRSSLTRMSSQSERTTPPRTRTSSLTSPPTKRSTPSSDSNGLHRTSSARITTPRKQESMTRPSMPPPRGSLRGSTLTFKSRLPIPEVLHPPQIPSVPFYVSRIHAPSTHPSFCHLEKGDLASWLTVEEEAGDVLELEVWYEDDGSWRKLENLSRTVKLKDLRKVDPKQPSSENVVELTFSSDPKQVYYVPPSKGEVKFEGAESAQGQKTTVKGIVERSLRETRMKKGVSVAGLHQLVNMQAVIADTERGIQDVQKNIDRLLLADADHRGLRRDNSQREERVRWISEKAAEVDTTTSEARARITLRRSAIESRRGNLAGAATAEELLVGSSLELLSSITSVESENASLQPLIYHYRSHHAQALDQLFPIDPLSPSTLLYTILSVPLPIPIGPKDPAPPLSMSVHLPDSKTSLKIDERHTSAALGYVAMAVQCLAHLHLHQGGGVPYPVTCAGSRSLVKDVVSVMQGPRGFPLYGKGVERYRYEYAVFLLNKDIESLMQMANVRLLDLRHTLPNLKALLLTLSSPIPPPPRPLILLDSSVSRNSSRQTSRAWTMPPSSPGSSSIGIPDSPRSGIGIGGMGVGVGVNTPSPGTGKVSKSGTRSRLSNNFATTTTTTTTANHDGSSLNDDDRENENDQEDDEDEKGTTELPDGDESTVADSIIA